MRTLADAGAGKDDAWRVVWWMLRFTSPVAAENMSYRSRIVTPYPWWGGIQHVPQLQCLRAAGRRTIDQHEGRMRCSLLWFGLWFGDRHKSARV